MSAPALPPELALLEWWRDAAWSAPRDALKRAAALLRLQAGAEVPVAPTPADVVFTENKLRLLRYRRSKAAREAAPVLLVPSIINRYYVLDLTRGFSLVEFLRDQGFDVWMIDWGTPGPEDRFVTLDDHVERLLLDCVHEVTRATGRRAVSLVGYCIGGLLATLFAALHGGRVASLVTLAAPIDFHDEGLLSAWTRPRHFPVDQLIDTWGNMPAALLQTSFQWLVPTVALRQNLALWDRVDQPEKLVYPRALARWAEDNVDVPGETYRKFVRDCYQRNLLVQDRLQVGGRSVRLRDIRCPLLVLTAGEDHICPAPSSEALARRVGSTDATVFRGPGRHIGAFVGPAAKREVWPRLRSWLAERG